MQIFDNLQECLDEITAGVNRGLELGCQVAEGYAKIAKASGGRCPVDTGRLRNSISHVVEGKKGYIGSAVEYAPYQESINGFLKYAVSDHRDEIKAAMKQGFSK